MWFLKFPLYFPKSLNLSTHLPHFEPSLGGFNLSWPSCKPALFLLLQGRGISPSGQLSAVWLMHQTKGLGLISTLLDCKWPGPPESGSMLILSILNAVIFVQLSIFPLLWSRLISIKSVFRQENKTNLEYTLDRPGPAAHVFLVVAFLCQNTVVIC